MHIDREKIIASGNDVSALIRVRTKLQSDVEILGERLKAAGKALSITAALFLTINEAGKITKAVRVRDNLDVMRQLGIPADQMQSLIEKIEQRLAA
jgi:hypothetical protein